MPSMQQDAEMQPVVEALEAEAAESEDYEAAPAAAPGPRFEDDVEAQIAMLRGDVAPALPAAVMEQDEDVASRAVAQALADWCGTRELDGANISQFYQDKGPSYKAAVQEAKAPGLKKGLRSFIALHADLLTCRMDGLVLLISKSGASDPDPIAELLPDADADRRAMADPIAELSAKLKNLQCGNNVPLAAIENVLAPLKEDTSMRQFAKFARDTGLCLTNGKVYGNQLPQQLKHKALRVNKAEAKKYPLVKKCLVMCL